MPRKGKQYHAYYKLTVTVRTGEGTVSDGPYLWFDDVVETVSKSCLYRSKTLRMKYKGNYYRVHGGIRTPYFICLNNPRPKKPVKQPVVEGFGEGVDEVTMNQEAEYAR